MKFTEFDIHPTVQAGIDAVGYTDCTEVQEQSLQHALDRRDLMVQSQTGSGKTALFLIACVQSVAAR